MSRDGVGGGTSYGITPDRLTVYQDGSPVLVIERGQYAAIIARLAGALADEL